MNTTVSTAVSTNNEIARDTTANSATGSRLGRSASMQFGALTLAALMTFGTLLSLHTMAVSDLPTGVLAGVAAVSAQA
jgi:hypothetical protein